MTNKRIIGLDLRGNSPRKSLDLILEAEKMGIPAIWITSSGGASDTLSLLAAGASLTKNILLGTSIAQTWSRHPVVMAEQAFTIYDLAPNRLRLGIGSGHKTMMERTFGVEFRQPLGHLREYVTIIKELLRDGHTSFKGDHYSANYSLKGTAPDLPVMISALRQNAYKTAGETADGAISWVCPHFYATGEALKSLRQGALNSGRNAPPLILQSAICISEDIKGARDAVRNQLSVYPTLDFYVRMFEQSGFEVAQKTGWTDEMIDSILITGNEQQAAEQLDKLFTSGISEILASIVTIPHGIDGSNRSMKFISEYCS